MNLRDLHYLVAVAKYGHFGKAATACHVSQPALSMQIKRLENYLGLKLFERTNKTVFLTNQGRLLTEHAKIILAELETFYKIAKSNIDPLSGKLKLGIIPTIAPYLLPHVFQKIKKTFKKLEIYLVEEKTDLLLEKLKTGDIDAAILALPSKQTNLTETFLFDDEFFLSVSTQHPLAKKNSIKPYEIKNKNLLLLEEGHCLSAQVLAFCDKNNIQAVQEFKASSLETLRYMVAENIGITLMPKLACRHHDGTQSIKINVNPFPKRTIGMVWRNSSAKTILLETLARKIKELRQ